MSEKKKIRFFYIGWWVVLGVYTWYLLTNPTWLNNNGGTALTTLTAMAFPIAFNWIIKYSERIYENKEMHNVLFKDNIDLSMKELIRAQENIDDIINKLDKVAGQIGEVTIQIHEQSGTSRKGLFNIGRLISDFVEMQMKLGVKYIKTDRERTLLVPYYYNILHNLADTVTVFEGRVQQDHDWFNNDLVDSELCNDLVDTLSFRHSVDIMSSFSYVLMEEFEFVNRSINEITFMNNHDIYIDREQFINGNVEHNVARLFNIVMVYKMVFVKQYEENLIVIDELGKELKKARTEK